MAQPYELARTFAPAADFDEQLAKLNLDGTYLCTCVGISTSTYTRMQRMRTVSRKTAQRIARGFALVHGRINPNKAFEMLFTARPRVVMDPNPCGRTYHRRKDPIDPVEGSPEMK
jgi:hypothetical protein